MTCETCRDLLNEALNLACRSDQFEEHRRRQAMLDASSNSEEWLESGRFDAFLERYNLTHPHAQMATKSLTVHLWVQDQYDKDLHEWQQKARKHLTQGCQP
jgi:hypothetical protein